LIRLPALNAANVSRPVNSTLLQKDDKLATGLSSDRPVIFSFFNRRFHGWMRIVAEKLNRISAPSAFGH
jgi:hypothetical protein